VTASNPAGSADQTSDPISFFKVGEAKRNRKRGTAKLPITLPDPGTLGVAGPGAKVVGTGPVSAGTVTLLLRARGRKRHKLETRGRTKLSLTITYAPTGFPASAQTTKVRLRKKR
jgi:hypothetical protein